MYPDFTVYYPAQGADIDAVDHVYAYRNADLQREAVDASFTAPLYTLPYTKKQPTKDDTARQSMLDDQFYRNTKRLLEDFNANTPYPKKAKKEQAWEDPLAVKPLDELPPIWTAEDIAKGYRKTPGGYCKAPKHFYQPEPVQMSPQGQAPSSADSLQLVQSVQPVQAVQPVHSVQPPSLAQGCPLSHSKLHERQKGQQLQELYQSQVLPSADSAQPVQPPSLSQSCPLFHSKPLEQQRAQQLQELYSKKREIASVLQHAQVQSEPSMVPQVVQSPGRLYPDARALQTPGGQRTVQQQEHRAINSHEISKTLRQLPTTPPNPAYQYPSPNSLSAQSPVRQPQLPSSIGGSPQRSPRVDLSLPQHQKPQAPRKRRWQYNSTPPEERQAAHVANAALTPEQTVQQTQLRLQVARTEAYLKRLKQGLVSVSPTPDQSWPQRQLATPCTRPATPSQAHQQTQSPLDGRHSSSSSGSGPSPLRNDVSAPQSQQPLQLQKPQQGFGYATPPRVPGQASLGPYPVPYSDFLRAHQLLQDAVQAAQPSNYALRPPAGYIGGGTRPSKQAVRPFLYGQQLSNSIRFPSSALVNQEQSQEPLARGPGVSAGSQAGFLPQDIRLTNSSTTAQDPTVTTTMSSSNTSTKGPHRPQTFVEGEFAHATPPDRLIKLADKIKALPKNGQGLPPRTEIRKVAEEYGGFFNKCTGLLLKNSPLHQWVGNNALLDDMTWQYLTRWTEVEKSWTWG